MLVRILTINNVKTLTKQIFYHLKLQITYLRTQKYLFVGLASFGGMTGSWICVGNVQGGETGSHFNGDSDLTDLSIPLIH